MKLLIKPLQLEAAVRLLSISDTVSSNGKSTLTKFPIPSYVHLLKKGAMGHGGTRLRVRVNPPEMLISQCASLVCLNATLQKEDNLEITLRILSRMVSDLPPRLYDSKNVGLYLQIDHIGSTPIIFPSLPRNSQFLLTYAYEKELQETREN